VFIARNGAEAIEVINREIPDIVILDIMMPEVDGYGVCAHIKNTKHLHHIQVIFLSAKSKESDVNHGYDIGADFYITKPFSTRFLMEKIKSLTL
jgi:DNA-binding response OmpR family regulator